MKIAICAPFMQSDHWQNRLALVSPGTEFTFDEFYTWDSVREYGTLTYDAGVVALPGAAGLEAVHAFRERSPNLPLVWISNDPKFGLAAFDLQVAMFLTEDCGDEELLDALQRCLS